LISFSQLEKIQSAYLANIQQRSGSESESERECGWGRGGDVDVDVDCLTERTAQGGLRIWGWWVEWGVRCINQQQINADTLKVRLGMLSAETKKNIRSGNEENTKKKNEGK